MSLPPTIDLLLTLIDTRPEAILSALTTHPDLAAAQDAHGYSLVHAAASYAALDLLRTLIARYHVSVDLLDEDNETALFAAETLPVARCLVEELHAQTDVRNSEGQTAEEKIADEEGLSHPVVRYLRARRLGGQEAEGEEEAGLPDGVQVNLGTMPDDDEEVGGAPDPEIRRRIEELAARPDYQSDEVQRQLRELVQDVVSGMGAQDEGRSVRRRVD